MSYAHFSKSRYSSRALSRAAGQWFETLEDRRLLSAFAANIDFEPVKAPVPAGYVADTGLVYGDRGNGLTYGWNGKHKAQVLARHLRKPTDGADNLYDSYAVVHPKGTGSSWQIAVPDGDYQVSITVGDPLQVSAQYAIDLNGSPFIAGKVKRGTSRWLSNTMQVTVTNGFITLTVPKARVAKLDFITISQVVSTPAPIIFNTGAVIPSAQFAASSTSVATEPGGTTGTLLDDTVAGEWVDYTVDVPAAGAYTLSASVANDTAGGSFHGEFGGANVTGALAVPNTGSLTTFSTVTSAAFNLAAGNQTLRIFVDQAASTGTAGNFDDFEVDAYTATPMEGPFGSAFVTRQIIPAASYNTGGEGLAFHDTTATNLGNDTVRGDAVDIDTGGTTGNIVVDTDAGEWLDYTVDVATAGSYTLSASAASAVGGGTFHAAVGTTNLTGTLTVPNTGSATTFETSVSPAFSLAAGTQTIRIYFDVPASDGSVGNFDFFEIAPAAPIPTGDTPFAAPFSTGAIIPAAFYDNGGEGVAFHAIATTNAGNDDLRSPDPIGISAGGSNTGDVLSYTAPGEWLNYTVDVITPGNYELTASVANTGSGGSFHAEIQGTNVTGAISIPSTGAWTAYQTATSATFNLAAGVQILHVVLDTNSSAGAVGNFDVFELTPVVANTGETPFSTAFATNQTIPAAEYDKGGEGVAYHDTTATNLGGDNFRPGDAVDIQAGGATGNVVAYVAPSEWLNYTISVATAGSYVLDASVTNPASGATFHAAIDGTNVTGEIAIPITPDFTTYETETSMAFTLSAGTHLLHIAMDTAGTNGAVGNFDWFQVEPAPTNVTVNVQPLVWTTVHNATEGLAEAKSVGVDGKLYVFGGYFTTTPEYQATTSSEAYDPATDQWAILAPLPVPTTHMGIATDGTYIYIVGGYTYDPKTTYQTFGTTNSWKYDIATNTWSAFVPLPLPRGAGGMELLDGQLHFFDGLAPPNKIVETNHWMLDLSSANPQWVTAAPTPFSRNHFSSAVLDGKIYLMGGRLLGDDFSNPAADVITWDPNNPDVWTAVASLPQIRALAVSAVIDGYIFLAGGTTTSYQPIDTVIMYDPATNTWTNQTPIPAQRLAPCGGAVGNLLIVTTGLGQTLQATTWVANVG